MGNIISVLYGSYRDNRQGINGARFVERQLAHRGFEVHFIDAKESGLPMLNKMYKEYKEGDAPSEMAAIGRKLEESDGFILVSAEYNHSMPAGLKNLLDHFQSEYLYKPCGLVTYSAGPFGGVRSTAELRAVTGELGMSSIPSMLPLSQVGKNFNSEGAALDSAYERRAAKFLNEFEWYVDAMKEKRLTGTPN